jgi:pimeloyl-ACP methyl ester carboxylesterase
VRDVAGPGRLVLAGHSMGGMTVLNALRRHPDVAQRVDGVVLVSTASSAAGRPRALEGGLRRLARFRRALGRVTPLLRRPRALSLLHRMSGYPSDLTFLVARNSQGAGYDPWVAAHGHEMVFSSPAETMLGPLDAILGVDEDEGLAVAASRGLSLVVGSHDRLTPQELTRRMAARCGAELVVLDGIGHVALVEAPEAVTRVLADHLGVEVA